MHDNNGLNNFYPSNNTNNSMLSGFSLASGKKAPQVSEESLRKAQNMLNNSCNDSFDYNSSSNSNISGNQFTAGFSLASGKKAPQISEESLRKAQNMLNDSNNDSFNSNENQLTTGFSLASGKKAPKISEESLRKAQNMFNNSNNDSFNSSENQFTAGFSLASGKKAPKISEESLRKAQNMFIGSNDSFNSNSNSNENQFTAGFSLASGKKAPKISEESLRKAKSMFNNSNDDSFNSNSNSNENQLTAGFSLASGKKAPKISEESLRKAKSMLNDSNDDQFISNFNGNKSSSGFSLASGKKAPQISEESLRKAQNMFNDSNDDQFISNFNENKSSSGFSLASGKKAPQISEESLRKAQNMFNDSNDDQFISNFNGNKSSSGFSLASGKKAPQISEESLRKAKSMFNDSNDDQFISNFNGNQSSSGFSLASGKKAPQISEESLRKAKNMFNDSNDDQFISNFNGNKSSSGFSLASGKKAPQISEESLRKAQNMFNDSTNNNNNPSDLNTNKNKRNELKFLSSNSFETDEEFSQEIPSILSNSTPPNSQELSQGSNFKKNSPIFPHPPPFEQNSNYNSRLSSPFTSSMSLKVQATNTTSSSNQNKYHQSNNNGGLSIVSTSCKFSPTAMALHKAAGGSPMKIVSSSNQQQAGRLQRANNNISYNRNSSLITFSEDENNSNYYPQSAKYPQRTVSINQNDTIQHQPATPQIRVQPKPKPKSNQFKPPKQITPPNNNQNNQANDKEAAALAQAKNDKNKFFNLDKVLAIDLNQDQSTFNEPQKNKFIQRISLKVYGRYYGVPNHPKEPFLPSDAMKYRFEDGSGAADFFVSLIDEGFHPLLLKTSWVRNHYKWIVWKLMNLDLCYPKQPKLLCYTNVLNEFKYRAQIELLEARRSCIRLIYERDHLNNAYMVLVVSDILPREAEGDMIELSDGWYSVPTRIDPYLSDLVKSKQIQIGTKLRICNAQIDGETASEPLEDKRDTKLIIRINSVRRARWDQSLGYQKTALFPVSLSSLFPKGGPVPYIEVIIQRKYPFLYREVPKQQGESENSSQKEKNGSSPIKSIIRNQEQQSKYQQKQEQAILEAIDGLADQWQKELEEEGTDASNSSKLLRKYLKSSDQASFIASISNPDERNELLSLREKHRQQCEEFMRAKADEYKSDNTSEFTTFFTLLVTDLCPHNHSDAEVTFWRAPYDLYEMEELNEGMTIRIYQLETSDTRADRLSSRGAPRFEVIKATQSKTLFRKRQLLNSLSDIMIFANEMNLPVGTEFDFVCLTIKIHDNKLYVCDGTPIIAAIELRNLPDNSDNFQNIPICVENARFNSFDSNSGVAHFNAYDTTIISRSTNTKNKDKFKAFNAIYKLRELMNFDGFLTKVDQLISGDFDSYQLPNYSNISQISFMKNEEQTNILVCSICDFEKIDFILYNVNNRIDDSNNTSLYDGKGSDKSSNDDKLVFFFGTPFSNSLWKSNYIENHQELDKGLNLVINVTDGIGTRIVHINPLTIGQFFYVIGQSVTENDIKRISSFYEKYFECDFDSSPSWIEMKKLRGEMRDKFKLDITNVETMLRATFFHMELIYDIDQSVEMMKKSTFFTDLVFTFDEKEWIEFQKMLREILVGIKIQLELYDNGNLLNEHVSIVSAISEFSIEDGIRHYVELLQ